MYIIKNYTDKRVLYTLFLHNCNEPEDLRVVAVREVILNEYIRIIIICDVQRSS